MIVKLQRLRHPFYQDWGIVFAIVGIALVLRLWQLGAIPAGLYRDEAYNGLDALGVLQGDRPIFFTQNNGREPAYIYLTSLSVALFGNHSWALRLPAAVAGGMGALAVYLWATAWFGRRVGLLTAWLWAVTFWAVHLGRIGLRVSLLPPLLALAFWLLTLGYRHQRVAWWVLGGAIYGVAFYTYISVRLTPVFLIIFLIYLLLTKHWSGKAWRGVVGAILGFGLVLTPLVWYIAHHPQLFFGRSDQVSIFNPAIRGSQTVLEVLFTHIGRTLGMFIWRGDAIARHNLPLRPIFDPFLALPFLCGLFLALRQWRSWPYFALLTWVAVTSLATILAEDAPHFLRASAILPAVLVFPALGLSALSSWIKLAVYLRTTLVVIVLASSFGLMLGDYFGRYAHSADTNYLFEQAATILAEEIRVQEDPVYLSRELWDKWPSVRFLTAKREPTRFSHPDEIVIKPPLHIYTWPYTAQPNFSADAPLRIHWQRGALTRGDLEPAPYPLYLHYTVLPPLPPSPPLALFGEQLQLRQIEEQITPTGQLQLTWTWQPHRPITQSLTAYIHLLSADGQLIGQSDAPLGEGHWPHQNWPLTLQFSETRQLPLPSSPYTIWVGVYNTDLVHLPIVSESSPTGAIEWQYQR